jgi:hypothetical protein
MTIKLDLEVPPSVCNLLLASLAASLQGIDALMKQVAEQGNAQMQPPADPNPEPQQEILDAHE